MEPIKLTQYSHGAGCGCKISPAVLDAILHTNGQQAGFLNLLVGNETKDDAAVYDLGNGMCILSTTDFFMPIVDDPETFGAIASANAISDIYAMGGEPIMAVAILGWPVDKIPAEVAREVLEGSRKMCLRAGIPLAGGHSIDSPEPIFGLAVTGKTQKQHLKRNDTARPGSMLYLTKPLGVGIVTTAQKKGIVDPIHLKLVIDVMLSLNDVGIELGTLPYVSGMTDVTGFGLLGHLCEICEASGLVAEVEFKSVPRFEFLDHYVRQGATPGGTWRNWESYGAKISKLDADRRVVLADPQTSGGLLVCVDEEEHVTFEELAARRGLALRSFGKLSRQSSGEFTIRVV